MTMVGGGPLFPREDDPTYKWPGPADAPGPTEGPAGGGGGGGPRSGSGPANEEELPPYEFDFARQGEELPGEGGLFGDYQNLIDNPWQEGESDVLGSYNWMSSGDRTNDENSVYNRMGDFQRGFDPNEQDVYNRMRLFGGGPNAAERDVTNRYGSLSNQTGLDRELQGGYRGLGDPTDLDRQLQQGYAAFGQTAPSDLERAGVYQQMINKPGFDDATKAAMQAETFTSARSPFERQRQAMVRQGAARGNPNASFGAQIASAGDESSALESAARKNVMGQATEAIRQREAGATGLGNVQQQMDTRRAQGLAGLTGQQGYGAELRKAALAGLTGQQAQDTARKEAAAGGLAGEAGKQRGYGQAALQMQSGENQAQRGYKQAGLGLQAGENARQRGYALAGAQGKQSLYDTMANRRMGGIQGKQGLYNASKQQRAADLAALGNIGGRIREDYTEAGNASGGL